MENPDPAGIYWLDITSLGFVSFRKTLDLAAGPHALVSSCELKAGPLGEVVEITRKPSLLRRLFH